MKNDWCKNQTVSVSQIFYHSLDSYPDAYSEQCQTSQWRVLHKNQLFVVKYFRKCSILDVWQSSEYVSGHYNHSLVVENKLHLKVQVITSVLNFDIAVLIFSHFFLDFFVTAGQVRALFVARYQNQTTVIPQTIENLQTKNFLQAREDRMEFAEKGKADQL